MKADEQEPRSLILEGRKAVLEALKHEKPIDRLLLRKDEGQPLQGTLRMLMALARERRLVVQEVSLAKLDQLSERGHHQGAIALCPAAPYYGIDDILDIARERGEEPLVLLLDGVTDPHNLGAILRSAEAGGVHGVVIPKRRAAGLTGTVSKTSAGAINHVAVARVGNISVAMADLKKRGLWVACAGHGHRSMYEQDMGGPLAIVIGAEDGGASRLVERNADFLVSIPMLGKIESLNASVAAGILIYEAVRRRLVK